MLNVLKADGTAVDFCNIEDIARLFLDMVPDRAMRSLLFDTRLDREPNPENMDFGGYEIVKTMKRILNAAYVIVLCRWKQLKDDKKWGTDEDAQYFENSRFTKLFQSALSGEDVTLDLQIFSLLELWVDLQKAPASVNKPFNMIFDPERTGDNIGLILQSVRDVIKNASFKRNGDLGKYTNQYCNELCYMLLRAFMVFSGTQLTYPVDNRINDNKDFSISYKISFTKEVILYPNTVFSSSKFIASEEQIMAMSGKTDLGVPRRLSLYMRTETSAFDGKFQHRYSSFDGERQTCIQTEKPEVMTKTESYLRDIHETRKFLSFSYKNIREFAMIINDSIKGMPAKKRELFKICQDTYPKIIADIKSFDAPNIYWDNIITLMLLEMGVSDFLEKILCEESIFTAILENIAWRNRGRDIYTDLKQEYQQNLQKLESERNRNGTIYAKRELYLRIKTVLKAMNFNTEDDDNKNAFLDSLSFKYANINSCIEQLAKSEKFSVLMSSAKELQKIFSDIFMFLQIFYVGLDSYTIKQMELKENYSSEPAHTVGENEDEKTNERERARKHCFAIRGECYRAFESAAKEKLNEIQNQSLTQIFDGFCELCSSYNTFSAENDFDISDKAKRLKNAITRNYICDAKKLQHFASVETQDGEKTTVFEVLGNLQKYQPDPSFPEWLTYLKDIFMFLIYNEDYNERGLWKRTDEPLKDKDCDPIYPYIVTYYKENIDRDNVKKCAYRVPLPIAGNENEGYIVTLLTDEEYMPQTFYCIPLRYGSSDSWWINPFLIPKNVIRKIGYPESRANI